MLVKDIVIGKLYLALVKGQKVKVKVKNISRDGGWNVIFDNGWNEMRLVPKDFIAPFGKPAIAGKSPSVKGKTKDESLARPNEAGGSAPKRKFPKPLRTMDKEAVRGGKSLSEFIEIVKKQRDIEQAKQCDHVMVEARAGTGKTFTLIEGVKRVLGQPTKGVKGSEQQEHIWKQMRRGERPKSIAFLSFNSSIAEELVKRVPAGCDASTMHSLGYKACRKAYRLSGNEVIDKHKVEAIIERLEGKNIGQLWRDEPEYVMAVRGLVSLAKLTLSNISEHDIMDLAIQYEYSLGKRKDDVIERVMEILPICREETETVDFDDMIWLPIVNQLRLPKYDLTLVDEAQDLNRCQQELALSVGQRFIVVGDPRQAIYAFAGADSDSMPRLKSLLEKRGHVSVCPMTMTRRCGKSIVEVAKRIVNDFEAWHENPKGNVLFGYDREDAYNEMETGDMVLCRANAPLVSLVFRLIKEGKKANIAGKNIGDNLWNLIKNNLKSKTIKELYGDLDDYYQEEKERIQSRKRISEEALIALADKCTCIRALASNAKRIEDIKKNIDTIFKDKSIEGIHLSSIHKAKGLESNRVWIIEPSKLPHPMAKTREAILQEENLHYVGITRAIDELIYVKDTPKKESSEY